MNKEIPVKYNGEIVGYTTDEGKTIQFNDSDASKKVNEILNQKQTVWVSSRAIGEIKSDNTVEEKEKISYDISHFGNKQYKVMSKEKIILIHYINVGNIDDNDVSEMMKNVVNKFSPKEEDNIISYWIPVREGETRVECINPKLVSEEDFTEAKRVLDRNQEIVNNIINWKTKQ